MPKDDVCPLGFAPHSIRPTRCKRCFRDYSEHKKKNDTTKPEVLPSKQDKEGKKVFTVQTKTTTGASNEPKKGTTEDPSKKPSTISKVRSRETGRSAVLSPSTSSPSTTTTSPRDTENHSSISEQGSVTTKVVSGAKATEITDPNALLSTAAAVVRRRRQRQEEADNSITSGDTTTRTRQRPRPGSWSYSDSKSPEEDASTSASGRRPGSFRERNRAKDNKEQETTTATAATDRAKSQRVKVVSAHELRPSVVDESNIPESTSADVEFILQVKKTSSSMSRARDGDEEEDDATSVAATETTETTLTYHDSIEDLQATVQSLRQQNEEWERKCSKLERDKRELQSCKTSEKEHEALEKTAAELLRQRGRIRELEASNEELLDDNRALQLEVKELREEADARPDGDEVQRRLAELQQRLRTTETMCEQLVEENDEYKREINELEEELDEMQDNFREDQADEYRDLRKELEQTAKNCRVLQFKLRKAERRCEQLEGEKGEAEERLKAVAGDDAAASASSRLERARQLEDEVKAARDVASNMGAEMAALRAKLRQVEVERDALSRNKTTVALSNGDATAVTTEVKGQSGKDDSAQLMRELYDSMEREKDLKEQLKFSEEEATSLRKKLTSIEEENESLILQVKKMAALRPGKGRRSAGGTSPGREANQAESDADSGLSDGSEEQLSAADLRLQMELVEQEAKVLRKKMEELETENESLNKEIKFLEGALSEKATPKTEVPPPAPDQPPDAYYEQRIRLMENEAKELRRKLIDKERENERLSAEVVSGIKGRRGSKVVPQMQRSRSLDSDVQVDLRRQLQLVEQEAAVLRQKTLELEGENDQLGAENRKLQIRVNKKGPPTTHEQLAMDNVQLKASVAALERKLTQAEAGVPSNEDVNGGATTAGTAKKVGPSARLKEQVANLEAEMERMRKRVEELENENADLKKRKNATNYQRKTPRRMITEGSTKLEMRRYIQELEEELKTAPGGSGSKEKDRQKEFEEEIAKQKAEIEKLRVESQATDDKYRDELKALRDKNCHLTSELLEEKDKVTKCEADIGKLQKEKETLEKSNMRAQKKLNDGEINNLKKKVEILEKDLSEEKQRHAEIRKKVESGTLVDFEDLRKAEEEKHKFRKEVLDSQKKVSELEKKIGDLDQAAKESVKVQRNLKRDLEEAQRELESEKAKLKKVDSRQSEVAVGWLKERDELKKQLQDSQKQVEDLNGQVESEGTKWKKKVEETQERLEQQLKRTAEDLQQRDLELKSSKEQLSKMSSKTNDLEEKLASKGGSDVSEYQDRWKKLDALYRRERDEWLTKQVDLEAELKAEQKRRDRMERDHERELRDRDEDALMFKDKIRKADNEIKRLLEQRGDAVGHMEERIRALEKELTLEKQEYEDLTTKYELLEEDYLVIKAQGVMAKEQVESNYNALKRDHTELDGELKTLRETFNLRQDTWIKEKLDMQERIKELSGKLARTNVAAWDVERARLKDTIEEKTNLFDQLKKDEKALKEEMEKLRKSAEETKRKLDDYERVKAYGKNITGEDVTLHLKEIQDLKNKLQQEEKAHRSEMASSKLKTDQRLVLLQDEIHSLHLQNAKLRREKDTVKDMLDGAQKTISDLKSDTIRKEKSSQLYAEMDELKQKLDHLRKEKEEVLDKMDLSERNCSKVKTEYMTEKASWEIKMAEMQTKINELEETTILQGGRSKIFGVKTKLELAWQKEREEQHRLLTESHKMARDLKQRLLDVEGARDKERLEAKRHLDEFRELVDAEQKETQQKVDELQSDLQDLRDAHSKMRAVNDRLKREKDRMEHERDELRVFFAEMHQLHSQDRLIIGSLSEEILKIKSLIPTVLGEAADKSLKSNVADDLSKQSFRTSFHKISVATDELRRAHGTREEDRVKRNLSFRRAVSEDEDDNGYPARHGNDPLSRWQNPQRVTNYPPSPPSMLITVPQRQALYRKSLSLDQSFNVDAVHGTGAPIWKSQDSGGSSSSLPMHERQGGDGGAHPVPSPRLKKHLRRVRQQSSVESDDLSGASLSSRDVSIERDPSSSSELSRSTAASKPSKKTGGGMRERLKKLTKSKSIEGTPTADQIRQAGFQALTPGLGSATGSASSVTSETGAVVRDVKSKDLKSRIANLFKKSSSRSSLDKDSLDGDSKSRSLRPKPSTGATSAASKAGTLPRYGSTSALTQLKLDTKRPSDSLKPLTTTTTAAAVGVASLRRQFLTTPSRTLQSRSMDDDRSPRVTTRPLTPGSKPPFSETPI